MCGAEQGPDWPPGGPLQTWHCESHWLIQAFGALDSDDESWWVHKAGWQDGRAEAGVADGAG